MRLQDLAIITNTPLDTDRSLLEKFRAHDRVVHDPKTDLYSYRVRITHVIPRPEFILFMCASMTTMFGINQPFSPRFSDKLGKAGDFPFVPSRKSGKRPRKQSKSSRRKVKSLSHGLWRTVNYEWCFGMRSNLMRNRVAWQLRRVGAPIPSVFVSFWHIPEFLDLWHSLEVPNDVDLLKQLANEGLQATAGESLAPKAPITKKKGKKSAQRQRQIRLTNQHLKGQVDLSKDYVPQGK